jgi:hypothetical protein
MDNLLSSDDETLYLNSDFDVLAHNFAVFSKLKRKWFAKTYKSFKIKPPAKTTVTDSIPKTGHFFHLNKPAIFNIKFSPIKTDYKTKNAGSYYLIFSDTSVANKNLKTKSLFYKQLLNYYLYACN